MNDEAARLFREGHRAQEEGRLDDAMELYRASLAAEPTAEAHTFLGWAYSFQGRLEEAIAECRRAIEVDPSFGNPYNDIGAYLVELGRDGEAVEWFERAMKAERYEPRHFPHLNLARVHLKHHRYDRAIRELEKALEWDPGHEGAKRELVRLVARMN